MSWFNEEERNDGFEMVLRFRRKQNRHKSCLKPSAVKEMILASAMNRIVTCFESSKFGVVSAFRSGFSTKENFKRQCRIVDEIQKYKLIAIAHIGFWDYISDRCIFVPRIQKQQIKDIAKKFKQDVYIWGQNKKWWCFSTHDDDLKYSGSELKALVPDECFLLFTRIAKKKMRLRTQIVVTRRKQKDACNAAIIVRLKCQLRDLGGIEKDLFSDSSFLY